jgi:hypothetical protein
MILGFTGTQEGMNATQKALFVGVLARLCPAVFHHGDCVGADAEAHALVRQHAPRCRIEIHPPTDESKRAFCDGDKIWPARPYLARNKNIVFFSDELVATPKSRTEELRSGTWSTVRYARKALKRVHMVWP